MEDSKKYLFILNPNSGRKNISEQKKDIELQCNKYKVEYEIFQGEMESARDFIVNNSHKFTRVVAAGGDGTVFSTLNALMETKERNMAIIPLGTGNDFYKSLNKKYPRREFWNHLFNSKGYSVDVGKVNELYFLNIASFGYDAHVVNNYNRITDKIAGKLAYVIAIIYTLFTYKKIDLKVKIDNRESRERVLLLSVANGIYYGGGFPIAPEASIDDGCFDFITIKNLNNLAVLLLFPTLLLKKHTKLKRFVTLIKSANFSIISEEKVILNLDGELFIKEGEFKFSILENEINII